MNVLVDADVIIGVLLRHDDAQAVIEEAVARKARLLSVTPVRTEVLRGVLPSEESATAMLLDSLDWIEIDASLADRAGELGRLYLRTHPGIEVVDFLLAAAVQHLDAELLTRNVRHFPMFPGLEPAC